MFVTIDPSIGVQFIRRYDNSSSGGVSFGVAAGAFSTGKKITVPEEGNAEYCGKRRRYAQNVRYRALQTDKK